MIVTGSSVVLFLMVLVRAYRKWVRGISLVNGQVTRTYYYSLSDNLSIHWVSELAEHTRIHSTSGRKEIQTGPDERRRGFGQNLREFLEGRRDVAFGIHKLFMRRRLLDNVDLLRFLHQAKIRCIGSPVRCGTNFSFRSVHGR